MTTHKRRKPVLQIIDQYFDLKVLDEKLKAAFHDDAGSKNIRLSEREIKEFKLDEFAKEMQIFHCEGVIHNELDKFALSSLLSFLATCDLLSNCDRKYNLSVRTLLHFFPVTDMAIQGFLNKVNNIIYDVVYSLVFSNKYSYSKNEISDNLDDVVLASLLMRASSIYRREEILTKYSFSLYGTGFIARDNDRRSLSAMVYDASTEPLYKQVYKLETLDKDDLIHKVLSTNNRGSVTTSISLDPQKMIKDKAPIVHSDESLNKILKLHEDYEGLYTNVYKNNDRRVSVRKLMANLLKYIGEENLTKLRKEVLSFDPSFPKEIYPMYAVLEKLLATRLVRFKNSDPSDQLATHQYQYLERDTLLNEANEIIKSLKDDVNIITNGDIFKFTPDYDCNTFITTMLNNEYTSFSEISVIAQVLDATGCVGFVDRDPVRDITTQLSNLGSYLYIQEGINSALGLKRYVLNNPDLAKELYRTIIVLLLLGEVLQKEKSLDLVNDDIYTLMRVVNFIASLCHEEGHIEFIPEFLR